MSRLRALSRRSAGEEGFGLVELLIAMTIMSVGLMAILATFASSAISVNRAGHANAAAVLADAQIEAYRVMTYDDIGLDTAAFAGLDATYKNDSACYDSATATDCTQAGSPAAKKLIGPTYTNTCATINGWYTTTNPCTPSRTVSSTTTPASPDGHSYRIDTYIALLPAVTASGSIPAQRVRKQVEVVVRDTATSVIYARQTSLFDCATGMSPSAGAPAC
jgi:prepilin-type N-terminal cleavage/methylation domain-containing protein